MKRTKLFGTDGIRGTPGEYPLTDEMLTAIAGALAALVKEQSPAPRTPVIVIGKDTRLSGDLIEKTISRNLTACGVNVKCTGTITTPGLAYLTGKLTADAGIMISASHNKPSDNGIKLFNGAGYKLSPDDEEQIEKVIFGHNGKKTSLSQRKGRVYYVKNAQERYVAFLKSTVSGLDLSGIHVALDCAWGAASPFAKRLFTELGARVTSIHDAPSGHKVNDGGAVKPELLQELVRQAGAHIGVAVDGDGDRGILVNEKGDVLDGDRTMAIIARHMLKNGTLPKRSIVASVMSNLGLRETVAEAGGTIVSAGVGDKYVLEALLKHGLSIGGEQSGHIIFLEHLSTPDGLLTALQVLGVMRDTGKSLSELASCMRRFPQILVNVRVKEKRPFESIPAFPDRLRDCHDRLKEDGRILLRYSGTELLARVMVEGRNRAMIEDIAHSLAAHIREEIGIEQ